MLATKVKITAIKILLFMTYATKKNARINYSNEFHNTLMRKVYNFYRVQIDFMLLEQSLKLYVCSDERSSAGELAYPNTFWKP